MDLLWSKIVSILVLATCSLLSGLLPLKVAVVNRSKNSQEQNGFSRSGHKFLKVMLSFSGGVLLATCFLHLIPDVREQFEVALPNDSDFSNLFPVAELTICIGYFIIYAIEEIVEYFVCRSCEQHHHHHGEKRPLRKGDKTATTGASAAAAENGHGHQYHHPMSSKSLASALTASLVNSDVDCMSPVHSVHGGHREPHQVRDCKEYNKLHHKESVGCCSSEECPLLTDVHDIEKSRSVENYGSGLRYEEAVDGVTNFKDDHEEDIETLHAVKSTLRGMMLIVGLSFHSIFEGMAIGLQTNTVGVWTSFAAVALHKFIMAFCVGIKIVSVNSKVTFYVICMVTFALVSPLGIVIGTVVTEASWEEAGGSGLTVACLQGVACGTLIYVTFFEVLARNEEKEPPSLLNFLAVFIGFLIIAGIHTMDTHSETQDLTLP